MSATKWKIQTSIYRGWGDMKTCFDGDNYVDDHYEKIEEAASQMAEFIKCGDSDGTDYRVVKVSVPQDEEIYD